MDQTTYFMQNFIFIHNEFGADTDPAQNTFNLTVKGQVKRGTCPLTWVPLLWSWTPERASARTHTHTNTHLQPGLDPPARARLSMPMQVQTVREGEDFTSGYSKMSPFLFQQLWLFVPTRKRRGCSLSQISDLKSDSFK